ncbi:MAG TPA: hypothetical protein VGH47_04280 [Xanthobacteraceae bacterium]
MPPRINSPEHEQWLDGVVSLTEAAALRRVSVETLRNLVRDGRLHAVNLSERKRGMTRREALTNVRPLPAAGARPF